MDTGYIHLYCGDGKGKTTAAIGLALRAVGQGKRVVILQFLKNNASGERRVLEKLEGVTLLEGPESVKFTFRMNEAEKQACSKQFTALFHQAVALCTVQPLTDLLVLDEALGAVSSGILSLQELLDFIQSKPQGLELVLTGRNPPTELLELADYISEIKKIKHPYDRNIPSRRGIEF